ncbi:hypothetical protein PI125_g6308 [Phytophthora idaei]|nr:hypothetical protein PI125_g6308 [Phytophthora idaei]
MHKLWEKFSGNVKGQAAKIADAWSVERPVESAWNSVVQFKANGRIVPAAKSPELWNWWTAYQLGSTVTLMIYEYGLGVPNARILDEFMQACIRPQHTDRSGAAAEVSIREMTPPPPPARLERYLSPSDRHVHEHLVHLTRSTRVALDTVNLAIADNQELRNAWELFGRRLKTQRFALEARKVTLEGYLADIPLPDDGDVHDPIPRMENIEDSEHQE